MEENNNYLIPASVILAVILAGYTWASADWRSIPDNQINNESAPVILQTAELPAVWGDLGKKMTNSGVIDRAQFEALYANRGGLSDADKKLLDDSQNGRIVINQENSGVLLNLLWALGLGNKNEILEKGPMADPKYGGAGGFASTGGWTLAKGGAMEHYGKHLFIVLSPEQQALVERVSKNIYRPCCNNSTYFPDCNHGMAMLGLLELLASQGVGEDEMYKTALQVNSFWFPDQYATIARYLGSKGQKFQDANAKEILGINFSSGSGYAKVESELPRQQNQSGGSCGA